MGKNVKLVVSIGDICLAYGCVVAVTCAIACLSYKYGQTKSKLEIVGILNEYLDESRK